MCMHMYMYMYMHTSVLYVPVQIIHSYMAEPYAPWARLRRGSLEYKTLKEQRAEQLWGLIEKVCVRVCVCVCVLGERGRMGEHLPCHEFSPVLI